MKVPEDWNTWDGGPLVRADDIERACRHGSTDLEIHDTVLIAEALCSANRHADGLATWAPQDTESYRLRAAAVAENGHNARIVSRRISASSRSAGRPGQ